MLSRRSQPYPSPRRRLILMRRSSALLIAALCTAGSVASANGFDPSNPQHVEQCNTVVAFQYQIAQEAETQKVPARRTPTFQAMAAKAELAELANIIAEYTDGVRGAVSPRVGMAYSIYGLCFGVSNNASFTIAPLVGKACNNAPVDKESECVAQFLDRAKARVKLQPDAIREALKEIGR